MTHFVSVVIPVRNEIAYMQSTLDAISMQDYPLDRLEVIIADGMSSDGTRELVDRYCNTHYWIKLVENKSRTVSFGLNAAIAMSQGDVIVRMDSHSLYPSNYISTLVKALDDYSCDNVGCVIDTIPAKQETKCLAISMALSHPFGVGNAWFRIGLDCVKEVDTVPFGCFRREVFDEIGVFDEELIRNQDDEFNGRMKKHGMKILLIPFLKVRYYARDSYWKLFKMYYQYGLFKPLVNIKLGQIATIRQLVPFLFVLFLVVSLFLSFIWNTFFLLLLCGCLVYLIVSLIVTISFLQGRFNFTMIGHLTLTFFLLHTSYGLGYFKGLILLPFRKSFAKTGNNITR